MVRAGGTRRGGLSLTQATQYVQSVVTARHTAGDTAVSYVDFGEQDQAADGIGCDYHPSLATHQKLATKLTAAIKLVTGW